MESRIDVLTEHGAPTGMVVARTEAHKRALWHAGIHVWIYGSTGRVLVQQRAADQEIFPLLWEIGVTGHVEAGETPLMAAQREVKEETGAQAELDEFDHLFQHSLTEHVPGQAWDHQLIQWVYGLQRDWSLEQLQHGQEVAKLDYIAVDDMAERIAKGDFVPYGSEYVRFMVTELQRLTAK